MSTLSIGSIRCAPGQKAHGYLEAVRRVDGTTLGIPVIVVCGRRDGPVLMVDGAIHGDEPEGTLAVQRVARELDAETLRGVFIGVPVMNVGAFEAMGRGNPRDTHTFDMNRIYPGKPEGFLTDRIASRHHAEILCLADLEMSIHSGGNISYLAETIFTSAGDARSEELGYAMGADWPVLLETPHPLGSPMAAMVARGKPAITVELGGAATCMPEALAHNVDVLTRAILNVCRHYDMLDGTPTYAEAHWRGRQKVVQATASGVLEPVVANRLKQAVSKGETLLRTVDLFGDLVEELKAPCNGTVFGLRTYPSVTAGDWALFCADAELRPYTRP